MTIAAPLQIVFPGALAALQDPGRHGLRRAGVPQAGALAPAWLRIANVLAGNAVAQAAIEFFGGGLVLRAPEAPVRLGLAGPFACELVREDGRRQALSGWRSLTLAPGETLRCGAIDGARVGYVAVGGLTTPRLLGSASTYARAGFGRALAPGDRLVAASSPGGAESVLSQIPQMEVAPVIRIVLGPQSDYFTEGARQALLSGEYRVTAESDRMGMRLDGPMLAHLPEKGVEIASDATVPGSIQVPGKGLPIVLLNDGQTAGGYPKIATVISADLPRLAILPVGATLRFAAVDVAAAEAAARAEAAALAVLVDGIVPALEAGEIDEAAIYSANLVSGMVDALF